MAEWRLFLISGLLLTRFLDVKYFLNIEYREFDKYSCIQLFFFKNRVDAFLTRSSLYMPLGCINVAKVLNIENLHI